MITVGASRVRAMLSQRVDAPLSDSADVTGVAQRAASASSSETTATEAES